MKNNIPIRVSRLLKKSFGVLAAAALIAGNASAQTAPCGKSCGDELVTNGNFDQGNTGFYTDFHLTGSPKPTGGVYKLGDCQVYWVAPSAYTIHPNNWWTKWDHTTANTTQDGKFFIGDAQCNGTPQRAWYQTVNVVQGQSYVFSAWASNLDDASYDNMAVFTIKGGTSVITVTAPIKSNGTQPNGRWSQVCGTYLATTTGPVQLEVGVVPSIPGWGLMGADFGLDDISFKAASPGDPNFTVNRKSECPNDFITFVPNTTAATHSWDFGSANAVPATSTEAVGHTMYPQPGTYTVTHTISSPITSCTEVFQTTIVVRNDCEKTGCNDVLQNCGSNLVTNGDFESGATGFTSGLLNISGDVPVSFGSCGGRYTIDVSTASHTGKDSKHSSWNTANDKTSGTGKFLIADPPCTSDGVVIWRQTVNTVTGGIYNFSAWVSNLCPDNNSPVIILRVNGNPVSDPTTIAYSTSTDQKWINVCGSFTAQSAGGAVLEVEVGPSADAAVAADLGLDNVGFYRLGQANATFTAASGRICAGSSVSFASAQNATTVTHLWDFGNNQTSDLANPSTTYNLHGTFTVTHTVTDPETGCSDEKKQTIVIENCCSVTSSYSFTPSEDPNDCTIQFTNNSFANNTETGTVDSWNWTIIDKDGTVTTYSNQQTLSHTFNGPGPHSVCLAVTGTAGGESCTHETCQEITSPCELAICEVNPMFEWMKVSETTFPNETIVLHFENTSTFEGSNTQATTYNWSFTSTTDPTEVGQEDPDDRAFYRVAGEGQTVVNLTVMAQNGALQCQGNYCQVIDLKTLIGTACTPAQSGGGLLKRVGNSNAEIGNTIQLGLSTVSSFPNPIVNELNIEAEVLEEGPLTIDIIDLGGKLVQQITTGITSIGKHQFTWVPTADNAPGIYVIRCGDNANIKHQKIQLTK